jgi:hypothetical protein
MANQVDFLPNEIKKAKVRGRLMNLAVLASMALMVGVSGMGVIVIRNNAGSEEKTEALRASVDSMRHWEHEVLSLKSDLEATAEKHRILKKLRTEFDWSESLGELSESIPENAVLNYFHLSSDASQADQGAVSETYQIRMNGVAKSEMELLTFIEQLGRTRNLNGIEIENSGKRKNANGEENVTFQMSGTIH